MKLESRRVQKNYTDKQGAKNKLKKKQKSTTKEPPKAKNQQYRLLQVNNLKKGQLIEYDIQDTTGRHKCRELTAILNKKAESSATRSLKIYQGWRS